MGDMSFQIDDEAKGAAQCIFRLRNQEAPLFAPVSALATNRGDHFRHTNMVAGLNGGDNHPIPGMTTFIFGTVFRN